MFNRRQPPPDPDSTSARCATTIQSCRWKRRRSTTAAGTCGSAAGSRTYRDVVVSDDVEIDLDLQRGMAEIAAALERQDHARMTAQAQVFIAALQHDLIDAADFASG